MRCLHLLCYSTDPYLLTLCRGTYQVFGRNIKTNNLITPIRLSAEYRPRKDDCFVPIPALSTRWRLIKTPFSVSKS
ncbi:hypothetical protein Agabi119p4_7006 [Agaricus bisporus var. burnettii]|uniref:Uncharacterized protein n=1 Tax=Agaricus bisporus var. burnettii TaxID=192524 RepID=A0A8H7KFI0_AGABI|nr:hypothetical protein Agabi119p4_7006 [Agaricus bisporus var. burnettii]